ncbi:hypothetical protein [Rummeliibacillus stabekisii]|nr:hypothetical protein [Rummeliibacillus stabekisii]
MVTKQLNYQEEMDEQFFTEEEFEVLPDSMVVMINYWTNERTE